MKMQMILLAVVLLSIAACGKDSTRGGGGGGGGGGPSVGNAYGSASWTADITGADFTEIGFPTPFGRDIKYRLTTGSRTVYWQSTWLGNPVNYYLPITINGGAAAQDRRYTFLISENTLYWSNVLVPIGAAAILPTEEQPTMDAPDGFMYEPGYSVP